MNDSEMLQWMDGAGRTRAGSWWRPIPDAMLCYPGATWVVHLRETGGFRGSSIYAAVVDDFGTLTPVPYNHDSFNQPEH